MSASPRRRAVLFDLDGVLVDSFEAWLATVNETASRLGFAGVDPQRMAEIFGQGPEEDAKTLYPGHRPEEIRTLYDEAMPRHVERIRVGPESRPVLDRLGREGVARAVVTNTQVSLARRILETAGLLGRLDAWAGVGDGLREKPEPDLLLHALAQLGVDRADAVLLGDSDYDERAAEAAGVSFVRYDLRRGDHLRAAVDDALAQLRS